MLIDVDDRDAVDPELVVPADPFGLGQDRVVCGVLRAPEPLGDPGDGQAGDDDALQSPRQPSSGRFRVWFSRAGGVWAPHVSASGVPVAQDRDLKYRWTRPQLFVGQSTNERVARGSFTATALVPVIAFDYAIRQNRAVGPQSLAGGLKGELVQSAERD